MRSLFSRTGHHPTIQLGHAGRRPAMVDMVENMVDIVNDMVDDMVNDMVDMVDDMVADMVDDMVRVLVTGLGLVNWPN